MGGRAIKTPDYKQINAGDMSGNINGTPTNVEMKDRLLYYLEWTGATPVGTVVIEVNNDDIEPESPANLNPVWRALDFGSTISISGNTGNHTILIQQVTWKWIRARYVFGSGIGTLDAYIKTSASGV